MERFLGFVKQIRRSRRRKGKKYRPEEDYHEGYEDVYYYASEHFPSKNGINVCSGSSDEYLLLCFRCKGLMLTRMLVYLMQV